MLGHRTIKPLRLEDIIESNHELWVWVPKNSGFWSPKQNASPSVVFPSCPPTLHTRAGEGIRGPGRGMVLLMQESTRCE